MSYKNDQDQRKAHNEQLVRRMKAGESLWSYDSKASWFPPRPIIEKDKDAIKRLYDNAAGQNSSGYQSQAVRHIAARLKVVQEENTTNTASTENVG